MRNRDGPFEKAWWKGGSDMDNLVLFSFIGLAMFAMLDLLFVQNVNDHQSHGRKVTREGGKWNQATPIPDAAHESTDRISSVDDSALNGREEDIQQLLVPHGKDHMSAKQSRPLYSVRVMGWEDLRQVLQIEADSFGHPWSEQDFVEHLESPNSVTLVAERRGLILGYEVFGIGTPWIQLHSCVVRREFRRRGIGSRMVASVARLVVDRESAGIVTKIPERNVGAQLFFRQCGFRAARILRGYLMDDQDAYVMEYHAPERPIPRFDFDTTEDESDSSLGSET